MSKIVARTCTFGILFFYLYSVNFSIIPSGVGTRVYLSLGGGALIFWQLTFGNGVYFLTGKFGKIIAALSIVCAASIISILVNQTADLEFVKYSISMLLIVSAAYFVCTVFTNAFHAQAREVLLYTFIGCVALQCVLAVLMFANESIKDLLLNVVNASEVEADQISSTGEFRLVGFGSSFFGAGITNGVALMLICFCLRHHVHSGKRAVMLGVIYLVTALVGILMSRTTVLGISLSLMYLLIARILDRKTPKKEYYRRFLLTLIISLVFGLLLFFVVVDYSTIEPMINWAFEPIVNYFNGDGLKSDSTDQLMDMYSGSNLTELPWLIGDALFKDPFEPELYYMHVDVGYLRLIYYFGIPGLVAFLIFQIRTIFSALPFFRGDIVFVFLAVADLLLLNFKGFTDLFVFFVLFFMMQVVSVRSSGNVVTSCCAGYR
jgi:hypothetical protein